MPTSTKKKVPVAPNAKLLIKVSSVRHDTCDYIQLCHFLKVYWGQRGIRSVLHRYDARVFRNTQLSKQTQVSKFLITNYVIQ